MARPRLLDLDRVSFRVTVGALAGIAFFFLIFPTAIVLLTSFTNTQQLSQWLDALRFGVRYADREQQVNYSTYNWGNIANDWNLGNNQYIFWNIDNHTPNGAFKGYPTGLYTVQPFGGGLIDA